MRSLTAFTTEAFTFNKKFYIKYDKIDLKLQLNSVIKNYVI